MNPWSTVNIKEATYSSTAARGIQQNPISRVLTQNFGQLNLNLRNKNKKETMSDIPNRIDNHNFFPQEMSESRAWMRLHGPQKKRNTALLSRAKNK